MKAVILIHGFITSPKDFNPIYEYLYKNYDYVCKVVLPGHGENDKYKYFNVDGSFNVCLQAYDKLKLEYDIIDLIGFSLGGALATYLASVRDINKLVLLAPANKYLRIGFISAFFKKHHEFHRRYRALKKKKDPRANSYAQKMLELKTNNKISIKMALFKLLPHYNLHNLKVFQKIVKRCNKSLTTISSQTLICWGRLDQLVPYKSIRYVEGYLKDYKEVVYTDLSHLMLKSINISFLLNDIKRFLSE